jgi:hypothetical protein
MPDTSSNKVLMTLLALEAEDVALESGTVTAPDFPQTQCLPAINKRIEFFLEAVYGSGATITPQMQLMARSHLLAAMASDLVDETKDTLAALPFPAMSSESDTTTETGASQSAGLSRSKASVFPKLQRILEVFMPAINTRSLRIAVMPFAALLVISSVWTISRFDYADKPQPGNGASMSRGLQSSSRPVETAPEQILERDIAAAESRLGPTHPAVARKMVDLAVLLREDGRYDEAEALCTRALQIQERDLGAKDSETVRTRKELASVYRAQGRTKKADELLMQGNQP